jgi:hypothetical protein
VVENRNEGLLVRDEFLQWTREISQRMVNVVRVEDGALLLDADPQLTAAINTVLVSKGVRVTRLCRAQLDCVATDSNPTGGGEMER